MIGNPISQPQYITLVSIASNISWSLLQSGTEFRVRRFRNGKRTPARVAISDLISDLEGDTEPSVQTKAERVTEDMARAMEWPMRAEAAAVTVRVAEMREKVVASICSTPERYYDTVALAYQAAPC